MLSGFTVTPTIEKLECALQFSFFFRLRNLQFHLGVSNGISIFSIQLPTMLTKTDQQQSSYSDEVYGSEPTEKTIPFLR